MIVHKTEKARLELAPGVRTLGQRERTFLLLVDGRRTLRDIGQVLQGEIDELAEKMLKEGFIHRAIAEPILKKSTPSRAKATLQEPQAKAVTPDHFQSAPAAVDQFEGKRSLATTRMFLFDICERMFARKSPALAEQFRDALRDAKDRETMLAASRDMLEEIEKIAGSERADSISERIAMLLPPDVLSPA